MGDGGDPTKGLRGLCRGIAALLKDEKTWASWLPALCGDTFQTPNLWHDDGIIIKIERTDQAPPCARHSAKCPTSFTARILTSAF